jgi:hypothetical protein
MLFTLRKFYALQKKKGNTTKVLLLLFYQRVSVDQEEWYEFEEIFFVVFSRIQMRKWKNPCGYKLCNWLHFNCAAKVKSNFKEKIEEIN